MRFSVSSSTVWAALVLGLASPPALAVDVPEIGGHLTDPTHKLADPAKQALEDRLDKLQVETRIDVAVLVSDATSQNADALGRAAYDQWNIGRDWDNGMLLVIPKTGPVHITQNASTPELTADEVAKVVAADKPTDELQKRLEELADAARSVVEPKVPKKAAAPSGTDVPDIEGHLTDPGHKLNDAAHTAVDDHLGQIQAATRIDLAVLISGASQEQVGALGSAAFKKWNIGGDWDNGILVVFPESGRVRIIENPDNPELTAVEEAQLAAADSPGDDLQKRIDHLADTAKTLITPKLKKTATTGDHADHSGILVAAAAIALVGGGIWFSRRKG